MFICEQNCILRRLLKKGLLLQAVNNYRGDEIVLGMKFKFIKEVLNVVRYFVQYKRLILMFSFLSSKRLGNVLSKVYFKFLFNFY